MNRKEYNIVILNHHANAPDLDGGGRHYEVADKLAQKEHQVTILASSYDQGKRSYWINDKLHLVDLEDNLRFVRFKTVPAYKKTVTRFINYYDYMIKAGRFTDFKSKPDVIIASSVHPLAWVAGYKLSKKYNAKFIVEVRDLWPLSMYEDFKGIIRKIVFSYFEGLERKYYNLADAIITTAPFAYEYMEEKYGIDTEKIFHIPHGIDIDAYDENTKQDDNILDENLKNILDNNFCVTYTGALSKSEGLPTLIQSAKYLKETSDMKIVVVGGGSEREKLENIIKNEMLDNVVLIERQPRDYIPLILKKSDILFCGLMGREAFKYGISKNKFYDYMASKKPIIFASSVRGSLITKANAGITIEPGDPRNLADTIKYIYKNIDTLGEEYGYNGRQFVEKYHTTEKIANSFLDVIDYTMD